MADNVGLAICRPDNEPVEAQSRDGRVLAKDCQFEAFRSDPDTFLAVLGDVLQDYSGK
jgi:hypothetical protein